MGKTIETIVYSIPLQSLNRLTTIPISFCCGIARLVAGPVVDLDTASDRVGIVA
jgi:hypothetical protein